MMDISVLSLLKQERADSCWRCPSLLSLDLAQFSNIHNGYNFILIGYNGNSVTFERLVIECFIYIDISHIV